MESQSWRINPENLQGAIWNTGYLKSPTNLQLLEAFLLMDAAIDLGYIVQMILACDGLILTRQGLWNLH